LPNGTLDFNQDRELTRKKQRLYQSRLQDLRRTCRTGLARLGIEPHVVERVLNHVQVGIVGVYDRYSYSDEKRAALGKWEQHLRTLQAGYLAKGS
jgi:hypothetical protein